MSTSLLLVTMSAFALGSASPFLGAPQRLYGAQAFNPPATGCPQDQLSCHNTTVQTDSCCFENPGGLLMQVQFWDTNPSTGPDDKWTIHGLWPDYCNGSWGQFCDASREYPSITNVLTQNNATDLLDYMNQFWLDQAGNNEAFWEHEWNKHGTCMSTIQPSCIKAGDSTGLDAVYYFNTAINLYKTLPTYDVLAAANIFPSSTQQYTYDQLTSAVKGQIGVIPAFDCNNNVIFEISYYHNLRGSVIDGSWQIIDAYATGSCPKTGGLWYYPKNYTIPSTTSSSSSSTSSITTTTSSTSSTTSTTSVSSTSSTSTTTSSTHTTTTSAPSHTPTPAKRYTVEAVGKVSGCLLDNGELDNHDLCTHFYVTLAKDGHVSLSTSDGLCAFDDSRALTCSTKVKTAAAFKLISSDGHKKVLQYESASTFSSHELPHGKSFAKVYAKKGSDSHLNYKLALEV